MSTRLELWLLTTLILLQAARVPGLALPAVTDLCPFNDEDTCQKSQQCSWVTDCEPLNGECFCHRSAALPVSLRFANAIFLWSFLEIRGRAAV